MNFVAALFIPQRRILLGDDTIIVIDRFYDLNGDVCGPDQAVAASAGPDTNGNWWAVDIANFPHPTVH